MTEITAFHKALVKRLTALANVGQPFVTSHLDERGEREMLVFEAKDYPRGGISTYCTVGLSDNFLWSKGVETNIRVELVGACESALDVFPGFLSTAAFCVINSSWFCAPGGVFPDVLKVNGWRGDLTDLYFTHPFIFGDALAGFEVQGRRVTWLQAIPISRAETEYAVVNGPEALEDLLERSPVNIYDMFRKSVV